MVALGWTPELSGSSDDGQRMYRRQFKRMRRSLILSKAWTTATTKNQLETLLRGSRAFITPAISPTEKQEICDLNSLYSRYRLYERNKKKRWTPESPNPIQDAYIPPWGGQRIEWTVHIKSSCLLLNATTLLSQTPTTSAHSSLQLVSIRLERCQRLLLQPQCPTSTLICVHTHRQLLPICGQTHLDCFSLTF